VRTLLTVFAKEFIDNLRDRRTLISALLFGPLFGPALFGAMVTLMLQQSVVESDEPLQLTLAGSEHAPGLTRFLQGQSIKLSLVNLSQSAARDAVRRGAIPVVVVVPDDYASLFASASPAPAS